ncbi:MAG TPA: multiheme c-type cytochrome, partial [Bacteroidales bacterium]|nr:multiheme c-type cytochrome [Bacteroidales bacterium]
MKLKHLVLSASVFIFLTSLVGIRQGDPAGKYAYSDFDKPDYCGSCHDGFFSQWSQAMMSEAYTHKWDEIEYFDLAVAHAAVDPNMKGVDDGCNGCHTPLAYLAGDMPPPRPDENSRANESVSCEVCHNITAYEGDTPFNHNYIMDPGKTKYTSRKGDTQSPNHEIQTTDLHSKAEFCGICHNEKNPYGIWVKSTHLELKDGPYYAEGVVCQDCHMPDAHGKTAKMGAVYDNSRLHLFNGAHDDGKKRGTVELRIQADHQKVLMGDPVTFTVTL